MCRLYAMHANEPTRVECGLVRSQNALMAQSKSDRQGVMHGHGWGVADYNDGLPIVEKQTYERIHATTKSILAGVGIETKNKAVIELLEATVRALDYT